MSPGYNRKLKSVSNSCHGRKFYCSDCLCLIPLRAQASQSINNADSFSIFPLRRAGGASCCFYFRTFFITQLNVWAILKIGFIQEFAKILGVVIIARHKRHDSEMDGLILGAAAGMGFAALESNGYAFTAYLMSGELFQQQLE